MIDSFACKMIPFGRIAIVLLVTLTLCSASEESECEPTLTTASGWFAPTGELCHDQLIFEENFDSFNHDLWEHENTMNGGGNGEFQWYTNSRRNTFVENGTLIIRPTLTTDILPDLYDCHLELQNCHEGCEHHCSVYHPAPPIQSGLVKSMEAFSFKYGRVEISAKLPTGDWLWPALWLMPKHSVYGGWPRSGEIDLMEARGNRQMFAGDTHIGVEQYGSTLHFGTEWYNSAWWSSHFVKNTQPEKGLNRGYHLYQMEWAPSHFSFSLDNEWFGTIPTGDGYFKRGQFTGYNPWIDGGLDAPFDQEFYFILNLAIGGTNGFFPDTGNVGGKPWLNAAPYPIRDFWRGRYQWLGTWNWDGPLDSTFRINYIRVYAL